MSPLGGTASRRNGFLRVLGLVAGLGLACGSPQADRQAILQSRREAEFTALSAQAGMVTPSYLHPKEAIQPPARP